MTTNTGDNANAKSDTDNATGNAPEAGATPEAVAMHGDKARAEKYDQPETVALDGDTLISDRQAEGNDNA